MTRIRGMRTFVDAMRKFEETVFSAARVLEGFEGGSGAPEEDGALFDRGADDGDVAAVVARRGFLFV